MQLIRTKYEKDINEAKKWYAEAFESEPYFDEPFYVGFNIGGYELGLLPEERLRITVNELPEPKLKKSKKKQ